MKIESTILHPDVLRELYATPEVFSAIDDFRGSELALQKQLRSKFDDHIVRAALIMGDLRQRAQVKYSRADQMWFDQVGLEQATSEVVAEYKARRFSGEIVDICSGIGGDSIALGNRGSVVSIDRVAARSLCLEWNTAANGVSDRVSARVAEATVSDAQGRVVHIDPDRRAGARGRSLRIEDLQPGPVFLDEITRVATGGAIKLSPASNFRGWADRHEVELISWRGECREAVVWFGDLRSELSNRATIVPSGETIAGDLSYDMAEVSEPLGYVFDPDPALVRSGLLDQFALQHDLRRLDVEEEYLTSDHVPESGFLSGAFSVEAVLPHDAKALRRHVREHGVGRAEIKSRRIVTDVEKLRRSLRLKGDLACTILSARVGGRARFIVGSRVTRSPA